MNIGLVGLGKMGGAIYSRLKSKGFDPQVHDPDANAYTKQQVPSHDQHASLEDLVNSLVTPRCIWIMVPAGAATMDVNTALMDLLSEGDIIIDGGNSHYEETMDTAASVAVSYTHLTLPTTPYL